jgi:integration host factor subunit beta
MTTMTKKDLIDRIAQGTRFKRSMVKQVIQQFLDEIVTELGEGHRLEFRDFGVFESRVRASRVAQNPKTLDRVYVPAKRTVKFKVGRMMRKRMAEVGQEASPAADRREGGFRSAPTASQEEASQGLPPM